MPGHEEIRVSGQPAGGDDYPVIGETTQGLGEHLISTKRLRDGEAFSRIRQGAISILKRSRRFNEPDGRRTGLVVGYVQSGKTLSMTAVSALARDNGCRIIVLLAGVTTNLLKQNADRFEGDLRGASGVDQAAWRISNTQDGLDHNDVQVLQQAVAEWKDPKYDETDRQTFLYLVLKNHANLERLHQMLSQVNLHGIPALILDDEADQAGLNTAPSKAEASTTYRKIARIRNDLPHHTYLQYTATPQAPLLIALDDMLSPEFAELVQPGDNYTGGMAFFGPGSPAGLVKAIPADDLFKPGAPPESPPDSLLEAMRIFFVGSAVAAVRGGPSPRTMLIHPSPRTADHSQYLGWVSAVIKRWTAALSGSDEGERQDVVEELRAAYDDLTKTDSTLPPFEGLLKGILMSLRRVSRKEINSQDGSEISWKNSAEHILVGGEKLNRGFTVEGLTVTYMPRGTGDWNADTIQQRARFFGYRSKYLSLCRLFLHSEVISAYRSYVTHEEDVRKQLAEHRGRPLREWRRAFFLSAKMRPTRRTVLSDPYYKNEAKQVWFVQRYPHAEDWIVSRNRTLLRTVDVRGLRTAEGFYKHKVMEVPLAPLYRDLLVNYGVTGSDVPSWYGQLVTLADIVDANPEALVLVVEMHGERERTPADGAITLHQGRSSKEGAYPGDAQMCDPTIVTIQIHWINVTNESQDVGAIAVHIPRSLRKDDTGAMVG